MTPSQFPQNLKPKIDPKGETESPVAAPLLVNYLQRQYPEQRNTGMVKKKSS